MIVGSNAYKFSINDSCGLDDSIKSYRNDCNKITAIAVGPSNYYAVVCSTGAAWFCGPDNFKEKMRDITCSNIKHISFGYDDQWAITMKSGYVHGNLLSDCLAKVNEHNGDIKYVSLCKHKNDWIVGYGNNGHANGGGLCTELTSFLEGINSSRKSIYLVELGANNHYFISHENGKKWSMNQELSRWYKNQDLACSTVSLY
eukprot:183949_1